MAREKKIITKKNKFSSALPKVPDGPNDGLKLRGFFRIQLCAPGDPNTIVGDSGWCQNTVPNPGKKFFVADTLGASASSSQIGFVSLGTGTAPATTDTSLNGETIAANKRAAVTYANSSSSSAVFTATFASSNSFVTASANISNIGLFAANTAGTIFAGNTYASSSVATNQNVNVTYTISIS